MFSGFALMATGQGWCTCRCHGGNNVPASLKVEGRHGTDSPRLCEPCAELVLDEETSVSFMDYVSRQ